MTGGQVKAIVIGAIDDAIDNAKDNVAQWKDPNDVWCRTQNGFKLNLEPYGVPLSIHLQQGASVWALRRLRAKYNKLKKSDFQPCLPASTTVVNADPEKLPVGALSHAGR